MKQKEVTTHEFSEIRGRSDRQVTQNLSMLTILRSARPETWADIREQEKRIQRRLNWLGERYVSHRKMNNQYLITVTVEG